MKKQFLRVKQLADQTFLRADKSEALNQDELKNASNKMEYLVKTLTDISKKLPECSNSNEQLDKYDKRKKKYTEYALGEIMVNASSATAEDSAKCVLFTEILKDCGELEQKLADDEAYHEGQIEQLVSVPLNKIIDEIQNIIKHRKHLNKCILDKDAATSRYNANAKKENLKEDMEEADIKVDQSRDHLATEMFSLLRKENEISVYILQYLKMQRAHHEGALKELEMAIPGIEQKIGDTNVKPIFGISLHEHLRVTGRRIALPLELCVVALREIGCSEEGLFRVVGGVSRVKRLKMSIDSGSFLSPLIAEYRDVHVLASTLKSYLRELPDPLLTASLHLLWIKAMQTPEDLQLDAIKSILLRLPAENRDNLAYLMQFLVKLSKYTENKMSISNIAIVIAPNLLWSHDNDIEMHMHNCTTLNRIVELFLKNVDTLFPEDMAKHEKITCFELLGDTNEFYRPEVQSLIKTHQFNEDNSHSPKATSRLKKNKHAAPAPPNLINKLSNSHEKLTQITHFSGSSTLNRSHKIRNEKQEFNDYNSMRRKSLIFDETKIDSDFEPLKKSTQTDAKIIEIKPPKTNELKSVEIEAKSTQIDTKIIQNDAKIKQNDTKNTQIDAKIKQNDTKNTQIDAKIKQNDAKITQIDAKATHNDAKATHNDAKPIQNLQIETKPTKPTQTDSSESPLESSDSKEIDFKAPIDVNACEMRPIAAPRVSLIPEVGDPMSKNCLEVDGDLIQLRNSSDDSIRTNNKPAIPLRPASLRTRHVHDPEMHKTQVYTTPNKLQTSFVQIQRIVGHDQQLAEKEKFLGHVMVENKFNDVNCNSKPEVPQKPPHMKSHERLNLEPVNGNCSFNRSHARTRSDGGVVDAVVGVSSLCQTPPSPRKPMHPGHPPPPPPTTIKIKAEPETTAF